MFNEFENAPRKENRFKQLVRKYGVRSSSPILVTQILIIVSVLMLAITSIFPTLQLDLLFYPPLAKVQPHRFITSAFLHSGIMHLFFNMYALWAIGMILEPLLGRLRFLLIYLLTAFFGNAFVLLFASVTNQQNVAVVGASGAIFGLFGVLLVLYRANKENLKGLLVILGINFALAFVFPNISWQSHLGGFLTGVLLSLLWANKKNSPQL